MPTPQTDYDALDRPEENLEMLTTDSLETCVEECVRNVVCVGVTLDGDSCHLKHTMRHRFSSNDL